MIRGAESPLDVAVRLALIEDPSRSERLGLRRLFLRSPGRSAGSVVQTIFPYIPANKCKARWLSHNGYEHTRANAAAVAWKRREALTWKEVNAELERVWEDMPAPEFFSSAYEEWVGMMPSVREGIRREETVSLTSPRSCKHGCRLDAHCVSCEREWSVG